MTFHPFNFPASVGINEAAVNETSAMKFPRAHYTILINWTFLIIFFSCFRLWITCEFFVMWLLKVVDFHAVPRHLRLVARFPLPDCPPAKPIAIPWLEHTQFYQCFCEHSFTFTNVCKEKVKDDVMLLSQHFFLVKKISEFFLLWAPDSGVSYLLQERLVEKNEPERVFWKLIEEKEINFYGWESSVENAQRHRTKPKYSPLRLFPLHFQHFLFVFLLFSKSGLPYIFSKKKKRPQKKTWWQFSFNTCLKLCMVDMNLLRRYWSLTKKSF